MILDTKIYEIAGKFQICFSVKNVTMDTFAGVKNVHFDQARNDFFSVLIFFNNG